MKQFDIGVHDNGVEFDYFSCMKYFVELFAGIYAVL
jgi:hypothetical protein